MDFLSVCDIIIMFGSIILSGLQDLSLRGFWLQKWMSTDKAKECRSMIDYLLERARDGNLKYEYAHYFSLYYLLLLVSLIKFAAF